MWPRCAQHCGIRRFSSPIGSDARWKRSANGTPRCRYHPGAKYFECVDTSHRRLDDEQRLRFHAARSEGAGQGRQTPGHRETLAGNELRALVGLVA